MALDGVFLRLVKNELSSLIGGRVDKIYQPSREELLFGIRTREGNFKLLFNTGAGAARVHVTKVEIENPKVPPMFCMFMRKHLVSGKLLDIRQDGFERILYFDFDSANEMGDICRLTLAMEIMGRHSNLILINSEGRIIDSIKRVGHDMSAVRMVLPGMTYTLPPKEDRLSLLDNKAEEICEEIKKYPSLKLPKAIMKSIEGISPVFAREAEFYASKGQDVAVCEMSQDDFDRLCFYFRKTAKEIIDSENKYTVLKTKDGMFKDFCFTQINQYGSLMITNHMDSACEVLDYFYSERDRVARTKQRAQDLFKLLLNTSERILRRTSNQREELKECAERDKMKKYGDLIMSNLYRIEKGQAFAEVEDFYLPECPVVKIPLDKRLNASQNAQKYYKDYRKADTAEKKLIELIKASEEELIYIDSVFDALTRASSENDIIQLRIELAEQGYVKHSKTKAKPPKSLPPMKFISSDGFEILVGRNNKQNDQLTCKISEKLDIWLHTQNITGSHTVITCEGKQPPDRTIEEAAIIAAYHSKGKNSSQVPVDYTLIKNVKKPAGAKPGMVIFTNNRTVYVTPDEELVKKLAVN